MTSVPVTNSFIDYPGRRRLIRRGTEVEFNKKILNKDAKIQDEILEDLTPVCHRLPIESLDVNKLYQLLTNPEENIYPIQSMFQCLFQQIKEEGLASVYLEPSRVIGKGAFGLVFNLKLRDNHQTLAIVKSVQPGEKIEALNEVIIGLALNQLRQLVANFIFTYTFLRCGDLNINYYYPDIIGSWCRTDFEESPYYIVEEEIKNNISLETAILKGLNTDDFLNLYLQVIIALDIAYKESNFTHYDLHAQNVLIQRLDQVYSLRYKDAYINSSELARIIDYGYSIIEVNGQMINNFRTILGTKTTQAYPYYDAYKLLMYCLSAYDQRDIKKGTNNLSELLWLYQFFNPGASLTVMISAITSQTTFYYGLPNNDYWQSRPLIDLIYYIDDKKLLINNKPEYPELLCYQNCPSKEETTSLIFD